MKKRTNKKWEITPRFLNIPAGANIEMWRQEAEKLRKRKSLPTPDYGPVYPFSTKEEIQRKHEKLYKRDRRMGKRRYLHGSGVLMGNETLKKVGAL